MSKVEDNRLFKTEDDVRHYFIALSNYPVDAVIKSKGIMIDTKLRKDILVGPNFGKVTINGCVEEYVFKNLGGGVWNVTVTDKWRK